MKVSKLTPLLLLSSFLIFPLACTKDDDGNSGGDSYEKIELELRQIPNISPDYFFHVWLETRNGSVEDLGEIELDPVQTVYSDNYELGEDIINSAERLFVTVEPFDDTDPGPSSWEVLEVTFDGGEGIVNNSPFIATGDADMASGSYILATPTTSDNNDEFAGIWFVDSPSGNRMGLDLPELKPLWIYNGWVNINGNWLSTGPFDDPNGSDYSSFYSSGERPPFPFPGEDFINGLPGIPVPDLRSKTCYITIEPLDNNSSPFFLTLMEENIDQDAMARVAQDITSAGSGNWLQAEVNRK